MLSEVYLVLDLCRRACEETIERRPDFYSTILAAEDNSGQIKPKVYYTYDLTTTKVPPCAENTRLLRLNRIWHELLSQHEDYSKYKALLAEVHQHYAFFSVTPLWVVVPWPRRVLAPNPHSRSHNVR